MGGSKRASHLLFCKGIGSIYIILCCCESLILCISRLHLFWFYGALEGFAQFYSLFNFIIDFFNPKECCIPFLCSSRNYSICLGDLESLLFKLSSVERHFKAWIFHVEIKEWEMLCSGSFSLCEEQRREGLQRTLVVKEVCLKGILYVGERVTHLF